MTHRDDSSEKKNELSKNTLKSRVKIWIKALRLQTLLLSFSCAIMGIFLAADNDVVRWPVILLTILTAMLLQIVSNIANDYGDALSGADNINRKGPERITHTGLISLQEMKTMVYIFTVIAFIFGVALVITGLSDAPLSTKLLFLALGVLAIIAAVSYTMGKKPYGYRGYGDLFVFLFFGLLGVMGSYFMQTQTINATILLPAISIGVFTVAVLNINNIRDEYSDREAEKRTVVVIYGARFAKRYHLILITTGIVTAVTYNILTWSTWLNLLWLLVLPLLLSVTWRVWRNDDPSELIPELPKHVLATLLFTLAFGVSILL